MPEFQALLRKLFSGLEIAVEDRQHGLAMARDPLSVQALAAIAQLDQRGNRPVHAAALAELCRDVDVQRMRAHPRFIVLRALRKFDQLVQLDQASLNLLRRPDRPRDYEAVDEQVEQRLPIVEPPRQVYHLPV